MSTTDVEQLKQEVGELTGPLLAKYNGLDSEIQKREKRIEEIKKEMKELRDARAYLRTIVRNIDPNLIPPMVSKNGNKSGPKPKAKKVTSISAETMQAIVVFFQTRSDELNDLHPGGGFRPVDIYKREGFPLKSESAVNKVMRDLHETGILHLDRWVRGRPQPNLPTGKFYKVV